MSLSAATKRFIIESCTNSLDANSTIVQSLPKHDRTFTKKREIISNCFDVLDEWILSLLKNKKGAEVPNFATITWEIIDGRNSEKKMRPVFIPKMDFIKGHQILYQPPIVEPNVVTSEEINYTKLAIKFSNSLTKDIVFSGVRCLLRKIGEVCGLGREVTIEFSFGTLKSRERRLAFEFLPQALIDRSEQEQLDTQSSFPGMRPQTSLASLGGGQNTNKLSKSNSRLSSTGSLSLKNHPSQMYEEEQRLSEEFSDSKMFMQQENSPVSSSDRISNLELKPEMLFHGGYRPLRKLGKQTGNNFGEPSISLGSHLDPARYEKPPKPFQNGQTLAAEQNFIKKRPNQVSEDALKRYIDSMKNAAQEEDRLMTLMAMNKDQDEEALQRRANERKLRLLDIQNDVKHQMDFMAQKKMAEHAERREAIASANFPLDPDKVEGKSQKGYVSTFPLEQNLVYRPSSVPTPVSQSPDKSIGNGGLYFGPRRGKGLKIDRDSLQQELKLEIQERMDNKVQGRSQRINEEKAYIDQLVSEHKRQTDARKQHEVEMQKEMMQSLNQDIHMKNLKKLTKFGETPLNSYITSYAFQETTPPGLPERNLFNVSKKLVTSSSGGIGYDARR